MWNFIETYFFWTLVVPILIALAMLATLPITWLLSKLTGKDM